MAMIARNNRLSDENDDLKAENLEMSKRLLILDRDVGKLREQRMVYLLKEQDFLDLEQEVKLRKEMGAANKKCSRTRHANRYLCRVISTPRNVEEEMITGLNDTIRARKIRRLKLQRNIEIAEYHHIPWETPTDGDTDPSGETSNGGDNAPKRKKKRTKRKSTRRSPAQKRKTAEACAFLAQNTQPTVVHSIEDIGLVGTVAARSSSPVVSVNRGGAAAPVPTEEDPPPTVSSGEASLDNALRTLGADAANVTLANSLIAAESRSNAASAISEDLITGGDTRQQTPKRKYNKLNDLDVVGTVSPIFLLSNLNNYLQADDLRWSPPRMQSPNQKEGPNRL